MKAAAFALALALLIVPSAASAGNWKLDFDNRNLPSLSYRDQGKVTFMLGCGRALGLHARYPGEAGSAGKATITIGNGRKSMRLVGEFEEISADDDATNFVQWAAGPGAVRQALGADAGAPARPDGAGIAAHHHERDGKLPASQNRCGRLAGRHREVWSLAPGFSKRNLNEDIRPMRTLIAVTLVGVLGAGVFGCGPARAENLNLKFGPTWSCKMISAELNDLYESCRNCEKDGKNFNQLSSTRGECVAKQSLKGSRYDEVPPDLAREREIQQKIDDLVREREALTLKRMQEKKWRDSGVSGPGSGASRAPESRGNEDAGATPNGWAGKSITIERRAAYRSESKDGVVTKTMTPSPLSLTIARDGSIIPSHGSLVGDDQPIVIGRSNHTLPSGDATITAELSYPDGTLVLVLETHDKYTIQDVSRMELKRISQDECTFRDLSTIVYKRSRERVTINHTSTRCVIR